jgi:acyl-CoA synthetase (AMP-forming)/AMP-acid ligase II
MFAELLRARAADAPATVAIVTAEATVTWAELVDRVSRLAGLIRERGVRPGDRVLLAAGNNLVFVHHWYALQWAGAVCVPLHTGATDAVVAQIVRDSGIAHVVGDNDHVDRVVAAVPALREAVTAFGDFDELIRVCERGPLAEAFVAHELGTCTIMYTSGTTGTPKGVVLSHTALVSGGRQLVEAIGITPDDRILLALPLFHANPQVYGLMTSLVSGCSVAVLARFEPRTFFADAAALGATGFTYVGTVLSLLLSKAEPAGGGMRFCTGGGATREIWEAVESQLGVTTYELYGMTETGGWVTCNRVGAVRPGTCGVVRPDMELAILDPDDHLLGPNVPGQIAVRPSQPGVLFDGYLHRAELTVEKFRNSWFHTGDLGTVDEDGYLTFLTRDDDMIRRGGENVSPRDVEQALLKHPSVHEAVVLGVPDEVMGQEVKAVMVASVGIDVEELRASLTAHLPAFAIPRYVELRESLPKTPTEKIRIGELGDLGDGVLDLRAARSGARR